MITDITIRHKFHTITSETDYKLGEGERSVVMRPAIHITFWIRYHLPSPIWTTAAAACVRFRCAYNYVNLVTFSQNDERLKMLKKHGKHQQTESNVRK